jgi:hypothetical protein
VEDVESKNHDDNNENHLHNHLHDYPSFFHKLFLTKTAHDGRQEVFVSIVALQKMKSKPKKGKGAHGEEGVEA